MIKGSTEVLNKYCSLKYQVEEKIKHELDKL
jgi:hypothetical protein